MWYPISGTYPIGVRLFSTVLKTKYAGNFILSTAICNCFILTLYYRRRKLSPLMGAYPEEKLFTTRE